MWHYPTRFSLLAPCLTSAFHPSPPCSIPLAGHGRCERLQCSSSSACELRSKRRGGDCAGSTHEGTEGEGSLTRRGALEDATLVVARSMVAGLGLRHGLTALRRPGRVSAEEGPLLSDYTAPDGTFALRYPAAFKGFSKPLKTHKVEVTALGFGFRIRSKALAGDPGTDSIRKMPRYPCGPWPASTLDAGPAFS